jgi:hypothetical protein
MCTPKLSGQKLSVFLSSSDRRASNRTPPRPASFYNDYPPYLKKFDIWAWLSRVLAINPKMVDSDNRNIWLAVLCMSWATKNLLARQGASTWEDFLKPAFKGGSSLRIFVLRHDRISSGYG